MVRIRLNDIKINEISSSSGLFYGHNIQANFSSVQKSNEGLGTTTGDKNKVVNGVHIVIRSDDFKKYDDFVKKEEEIPSSETG